MGKEKFKAETKKTFGSKKALKDADFGGELENIWGAPGNSTGVVNTKRHDKWINGFAKKDKREVKQVVLPKGGQSYNPKASEHEVLLK